MFTNNGNLFKTYTHQLCSYSKQASCVFFMNGTLSRVSDVLKNRLKQRLCTIPVTKQVRPILVNLVLTIMLNNRENSRTLISEPHY